MAITRTAKGTATDKTSALTLSINSITIDADSLLVVGLSYDTGQGAPDSVLWGNQVCRLVAGSQVSGNGLATRLYSLFRRPSNTKNLVVTWSGTAPTAKAMFASQFTEVGAIDLVKSQAQAATASPSAGTASTSVFADEVFIGAMGSEGPSSDANGTPSNSYTAGQVAGTAGAPPVSNIKVQEIYKIVSATESTTAALTGAASRDWCSSFATFRAIRDFRMGISPTDLAKMRVIFDDNGYPRKNHAYHYNSQLDRWELYDIDLDTGTLRATMVPDVDWTEE